MDSGHRVGVSETRLGNVVLMTAMPCRCEGHEVTGVVATANQPLTHSPWSPRDLQRLQLTVVDGVVKVQLICIARLVLTAGLMGRTLPTVEGGCQAVDLICFR